GKLSEGEAVYYAAQIAEGLKHAHNNNVVHRDIKPQNIMITEDNRVKVTDFGIARAATASTITTDSNALGSVHYFSPEQARGGYTDETTDIYSLGIVMYEMLTGKLPYNGDSSVSVALKHIEEDIVPPRELDRSISPQLEAIILKCVQKSQGDRYKDIDSFINDLGNIESINMVDDTDESPTRVMPVVGSNNGDDGDNSRNNNKSKGGNGKTIALAVGLAFLLVSIVFFGYFKLRGILNIEEVTVTAMIGIEESEAEKMATEAGLNFEVEKYVNSDEYEEGEIVWQNAEPESKVKEGFTIKVHVSEGEELVRVPGLINHSLEEAIEI